MISFGNERENINSAPFLIKAVEKQEDSITFMVSFARRGEKKAGTDDESIPLLNEILADSAPLYPDANSTYEITFEDYILYMTRNESYTSWDRYEIRHGRYFILFERSRLLERLPEFVECGLIQAAGANTYKHYGIYCQNHIVDIITAHDPVIQWLSRGVTGEEHR